MAVPRAAALPRILQPALTGEEKPSLEGQDPRLQEQSVCAQSFCLTDSVAPPLHPLPNSKEIPAAGRVSMTGTSGTKGFLGYDARVYATPGFPLLPLIL